MKLSDRTSTDAVTTRPDPVRENGLPSGCKSHRYGVRVEWRAGPEITLAAPGKPALEVALSTEFRDGVAGVWSPEELLIASLASCFELTLVSAAAARDVPVHSVRVDATGHVERRRHLYRVVLAELDAHVETDAGREPDVERIAAVAHQVCLVANALDIPVQLNLTTDRALDGLAATHDARRDS